MILNDIVTEYKNIKIILSEAEEFFEVANSLMSGSNKNFKDLTSRLFAGGLSSANKDTAINDINNSLNLMYPKVTKLNTKARSLLKVLGVLETIDIKNSMLKREIEDFTSYANSVIDTIYKIIESSVEDMKKYGMIFDLIDILKDLEKIQYNIYSISNQMIIAESELLEKVPEFISDNVKYEDFSIHSLVKSESFEQITISINAFANMYDSINRLVEVNPSDRYYIRKIETGSILIMITGLSISIIPLMKFISFCFDKYLEYSKSHLDIKTMRVQFIQNELELVEKVLELNPELENKSELIERACAGAFDYFKVNPRFKIGGREYNSGELVKSLTTEMISEDKDNK